MAHNGDKDLKITIGTDEIVGIGNFHKTLPHNDYGEVIEIGANKAFTPLLDATEGKAAFGAVPSGNLHATLQIPVADNPLTTAEEAEKPAQFVNPQAGLASDKLTPDPSIYHMPPAPGVLSETTAAEIAELYWIALLRDVPFNEYSSHSDVKTAAAEIGTHYGEAIKSDRKLMEEKTKQKKTKEARQKSGYLKTGFDIPGAQGKPDIITSQNVFRIGLPGEEKGPFISQFFVRNINFGTQTIDQRQRPYREGINYLAKFQDWLDAQNSGNGDDGLAYNKSNEAQRQYYEGGTRYISTMRDLARFVNKDALHQAYFNAALLLLSGGAKWTPGNPYGDKTKLEPREAGFGTLGGPHILALVSEVATRALKIVWHQKWQVHLRLRPEAYGGLVHVQTLGAPGLGTRAYGLPSWVATTKAAATVKALNLNSPEGEETLLLPMAFTAGSPVHPAYGAGHATVAGVCVTVLKAFFKTLHKDGTSITPVPLSAFSATEGDMGALTERPDPYSTPIPFKTYRTGSDLPDGREEIPVDDAKSLELTIEGELNKLAMNVAMGRCMGGVHWRTDNTRSLMLGEAIAAQILADITVDLVEKPKFEFRTFARDGAGNPKLVTIEGGTIKTQLLNGNKLRPATEATFKNSSSLWSSYR